MNGGERSLLTVVGSVVEAGLTLVAAGPPKGDLANELARRGIPLIALDRGVDTSRSPKEFRMRISEVLRECQPDLVHCNSLAMSRLAGPVAQRMGIPSIGHLRDIVRLSAAAVADLNCHTRLLAVSNATRQWHVDQGVDGEKTVVLHNGVDLEEFQRHEPSGYLHAELHLPRRARLIGTIGQIGLRKGLDTLISAAQQVAVAVNDVHLLIVGRRFSEKQESRDFEADLHRQAGEGALRGRVHFLGWRNDVSRLLGELSALAHSARQEPLGRVLLEAAACGLPIVATDVGGTREIFPLQQDAAIIVPPDDALRLAEGMIQLLDDPVRSRGLGAAARQEMESRFDAKLAGSALAQQYATTLRACSS